MKTDTYQFPLSQSYLHGRHGLPPGVGNIKDLADDVDIKGLADDVDNERCIIATASIRF